MDTINRANFNAARFVKAAFALKAGIRVDDIDFVPFSNLRSGAFRFTRTTVDASFVDVQSHNESPD